MHNWLPCFCFFLLIASSLAIIRRNWEILAANFAQGIRTIINRHKDLTFCLNFSLCLLPIISCRWRHGGNRFVGMLSFPKICTVLTIVSSWGPTHTESHRVKNRVSFLCFAFCFFHSPYIPWHLTQWSEGVCSCLSSNFNMKRTGPEGEGDSKAWRKKGLMAEVIPCFFTFYSSFNFTNKFLHGPIQTSFLLLVASAIAKVAPMLRYNPFWNSTTACCKAHHEYSILLHTWSQAQTSMHTCWFWISRGRIIMCSMQY